MWFPRVYANSDRDVHGNPSANRRTAPVAPDVNTTAYSPMGALRWVSVASLASSMSDLVVAPASCALCGLPNSVDSSVVSASRTSAEECGGAPAWSQYATPSSSRCPNSFARMESMRPP